MQTLFDQSLFENVYKFVWHKNIDQSCILNINIYLDKENFS